MFTLGCLKTYQKTHIVFELKNFKLLNHMFMQPFIKSN